MDFVDYLSADLRELIADKAGEFYPDAEFDSAEAEGEEGYQIGAKWALNLIEKQVRDIGNKPRDSWTMAELYGVVSTLVALIYEPRESCYDRRG